MAEISKTIDQNLLPVQAYFNVDGTFNTFIGQGQPFYATTNPIQSGLQITNSTIDSSIIGGITPAAGYFSSGSVAATPTGSTDLVNKQYVDSVASGLSFKQPAVVATTGNLTALSGLLTIDDVTLVAGDRVLVRSQTSAAQNGIYVAAAGAWSRAADADVYAEYLAAYLFILEGSTWAGAAFVCTNQPGGTLGTTPITFVQFSNNATYTAGTGLSLVGFQFSIANTGVTAATKGSASKTVTAAVNAQGQLTSLTDQDIAIAATQITSGTIASSLISGAYTGITSVGTLSGLTVTATISGSINGNAATATTATTSTNLAGGASGSLPYQTAANTTALLAAGSNGQVLTLTAGVPSWATPTAGTVTSVSGTGTVSGLTLSGTVTSSGSLTLGGSLDLSSPPAIGGTTRNTAAFTTELVGPAASANFTRFPNALTVISNTAAGIQQNESHNIGLMAEGVANASNSAIYGVGVYGVGYTNGGTRSGGVIGEGHVSATGDAGSAIGVRGYANDTHAGGLNIGLYGDAANGSASYALYMNNGGIYSNSAQTWTLNGNLAFSGAYTVTIPTLNLTNALSTSYGGTGATTANAGLNNLLPTQTGNNGKVLTTDGTNTSWATASSYASVTDDTTSATTFYPLFGNVTTGNLTTEYVSSTKLQYVPSTGTLSATKFAGAATNLFGGATGSLPYQSAANTTAFLAAGTNGYILTLSGGLPAWSAPPSSMIYPGAGIPNSTGSAWGTSYSTTGSGTVVALATSPSFTTPAIGAATGTSLVVSNGLYSTSTYGGSYTDGIVVDYSTGNGRISVGSADTLTIYTGGVASTQMAKVTSSSIEASGAFIVNSKTVAASYSIPSGSSATSAGPITVNSGVTVTVPSGSKWVVL